MADNSVRVRLDTGSGIVDLPVPVAIGMAAADFIQNAKDQLKGMNHPLSLKLQQADRFKFQLADEDDVAMETILSEDNYPNAYKIRFVDLVSCTGSPEVGVLDSPLETCHGIDGIEVPKVTVTVAHADAAHMLCESGEQVTDHASVVPQAGAESSSAGSQSTPCRGDVPRLLEEERTDTEPPCATFLTWNALDKALREENLEAKIATLRHAISGKDILLVLGPTGIGKSTFIRFVLGAQYWQKDVHGPLRLVDNALNRTLQSEFPAASGGSVTSESRWCRLQFTGSDGLDFNGYVVDVSGFSDTRGEFEDLINTLHRAQALRVAKSIRVINMMNSIFLDSVERGVLQARNAEFLGTTTFKASDKVPEWILKGRIGTVFTSLQPATQLTEAEIVSGSLNLAHLLGQYDMARQYRDRIKGRKSSTCFGILEAVSQNLDHVKAQFDRQQGAYRAMVERGVMFFHPTLHHMDLGNDASRERFLTVFQDIVMHLRPFVPQDFSMRISHATDEAMLALLRREVRNVRDVLLASNAVPEGIQRVSLVLRVTRLLLEASILSSEAVDRIPELHAAVQQAIDTRSQHVVLAFSESKEALERAINEYKTFGACFHAHITSLMTPPDGPCHFIVPSIEEVMEICKQTAKRRLAPFHPPQSEDVSQKTLNEYRCRLVGSGGFGAALQFLRERAAVCAETSFASHMHTACMDQLMQLSQTMQGEVRRVGDTFTTMETISLVEECLRVVNTWTEEGQRHDDVLLQTAAGCFTEITVVLREACTQLQRFASDVVAGIFIPAPGQEIPPTDQVMFHIHQLSVNPTLGRAYPEIGSLPANLLVSMGPPESDIVQELTVDHAQSDPVGLTAEVQNWMEQLGHARHLSPGNESVRNRIELIKTGVTSIIKSLSQEGAQALSETRPNLTRFKQVFQVMQGLGPLDETMRLPKFVRSVSDLYRRLCTTVNATCSMVEEKLAELRNPNWTPQYIQDSTLLDSLVGALEPAAVLVQSSAIPGLTGTLKDNPLLQTAVAAVLEQQSLLKALFTEMMDTMLGDVLLPNLAHAAGGSVAIAAQHYVRILDVIGSHRVMTLLPDVSQRLSAQREVVVKTLEDLENKWEKTYREASSSITVDNACVNVVNMLSAVNHGLGLSACTSLMSSPSLFQWTRNRNADKWPDIELEMIIKWFQASANVNVLQAEVYAQTAMYLSSLPEQRQHFTRREQMRKNLEAAATQQAGAQTNLDGFLQVRDFDSASHIVAQNPNNPTFHTKFVWRFDLFLDEVEGRLWDLHGYEKWAELWQRLCEGLAKFGKVVSNVFQNGGFPPSTASRVHSILDKVRRQHEASYQVCADILTQRSKHGHIRVDANNIKKNVVILHNIDKMEYEWNTQVVCLPFYQHANINLQDLYSLPHVVYASVSAVDNFKKHLQTVEAKPPHPHLTKDGNRQIATVQYLAGAVELIHIMEELRVTLNINSLFGLDGIFLLEPLSHLNTAWQNLVGNFARNLSAARPNLQAARTRLAALDPYLRAFPSLQDPKDGTWSTTAARQARDLLQVGSVNAPVLRMTVLNSDSALTLLQALEVEIAQNIQTRRGHGTRLSFEEYLNSLQQLGPCDQQEDLLQEMWSALQDCMIPTRDITNEKQNVDNLKEFTSKFEELTQHNSSAFGDVRSHYDAVVEYLAKKESRVNQAIQDAVVMTKQKLQNNDVSGWLASGVIPVAANIMSTTASSTCHAERENLRAESKTFLDGVYHSVKKAAELILKLQPGFDVDAKRVVEIMQGLGSLDSSDHQAIFGTSAAELRRQLGQVLQESLTQVGAQENVARLMGKADYVSIKRMVDVNAFLHRHFQAPACMWSSDAVKAPLRVLHEKLMQLLAPGGATGNATSPPWGSINRPLTEFVDAVDGLSDVIAACPKDDNLSVLRTWHLEHSVTVEKHLTTVTSAAEREMTATGSLERLSKHLYELTNAGALCPKLQDVIKPKVTELLEKTAQRQLDQKSLLSVLEDDANYGTLQEFAPTYFRVLKIRERVENYKMMDIKTRLVEARHQNGELFDDAYCTRMLGLLSDEPDSEGYLSVSRREFTRLMKDHKDETRALAALKATIVSTVARVRHRNASSAEYRELVRHLCVFMAIIRSGTDFLASRSITDVVRPHGLQVFALYRLLGIDKDEDRGASGLRIENHLVEILTGEGKSITLAILGAFLALLGTPCDIVCYSENLTVRDEQEMSRFFRELQVSDLVKYFTFHSLMEARVGHVRRGVEDVLNRGQKPSEAVRRAAEANRVILIDEVDVFFSEDFYGSCYALNTGLHSAEAKALIRHVYDRVKNHNETAQQLHHSAPFTTLVDSLRKAHQCNTTPLEPILAGVLQSMVDSVQRMFGANADASARDWRLRYNEDTRKYQIGYANDAGDGISYRKVRDNETVFAWLYELEQRNHNPPLSEEAVDAELKIDLTCARFAYAKLPLPPGKGGVYKTILGVTGTLRTLQDEPESMRLVQNELGVKKFTYLPSAYGQIQVNVNVDPSAGALLQIIGMPKTTSEEQQPLVVWERTQEDQWAAAVITKIKSRSESGHPTLVFFDTLARVEWFITRGVDFQYDILSEKCSKADQDRIIAAAGAVPNGKGKVTLCTRAFGRGVDFPAGKKQCQQGGNQVAVIQTFHPETARETIQIKGRTARQGREGEYFRIFCIAHLCRMFPDVTGAELAAARDLCVADPMVGQVAVEGLLTRLQVSTASRMADERTTASQSAAEDDRKSLALTEALFRPDSTVPQVMELIRTCTNETMCLTTPSHYILILDASGSMAGVNWCTLQKGYHSFISEVRSKRTDADTFVTVITFGSRAQVLSSGTISQVVQQLPDFESLGGTDFDAGWRLGWQHYAEQSRRRPHFSHNFLFMTDGAPGTVTPAVISGVVTDEIRAKLEKIFIIYCHPSGATAALARIVHDFRNRNCVVEGPLSAVDLLGMVSVMRKFAARRVSYR